MTRIILCAATIALAAVAPALAGDRAAAEKQIDAVTAREHVRFLADDRLEGRAAGTTGNHLAGGYITALLERHGLEPGGDLQETDAPRKRSWYQAFETGGIRCRNIVAIRRGREDGGAGKDHVVLGAHYDHVGHGEAGGIPSLSDMLGGGGDGRPRDGGKPAGEIHNGADDNASGSAALLEIAKAVASLDGAPRRSVVLVWFDGEEHGLWGSQHYAAHPLVPLERCAAMINLDMVGRARGGRVQVIGAASAPGLDAAIVEENRAVGLTLDCDPFMVPNSDHFSFYGKRVPIAFFCTGLHADYHRPGDDWQKINADDMARIARLTFRSAMRVAEDGLTPEFTDVPDAPLLAMGLEMLQGLTGADAFAKVARDAYGGIEGLFVEREGLLGGQGLRVRYVEPFSPAARAALEEGDRIVKVAGRPATGALAEWRLRLLSRSRSKIAIEVDRDGRRVSLELEPGKPALEERVPISVPRPDDRERRRASPRREF